MAQRLGSNLILIDNDSLCHGTVKSCAMAHRVSSNLILIDNDSLCHGLEKKVSLYNQLKFKNALCFSWSHCYEIISSTEERERDGAIIP
jgi:hypothetical protein